MITNLPIVDTHCDVVIPYEELGDKFATQVNNTQTSLPLLKEANIKLIFAGFSYDDLLKNSYQQLEDIKKMISQYSESFQLVTDLKKVNFNLDQEKIQVILHIEGAGILEGKIERLEGLYKKGVRSLGFTHNTKNSLGTGALVDDGEGLTNFGKEVIKFCNEKNIILDLAHLNETGFYDVIKLSKQIPFVSHGNCYSLTQNPRNFKDDQLKKISEIDSLIGVFFSGKYLKRNSNLEHPNIEDAVAHIQHMAKIAGVDHICLGCDFGGITTSLPTGLENHSTLSELFKRLREVGFSEEDIEKIAYKNTMNYLKKFK